MFLDDAPERVAEMIRGVDTGDLDLMIRSAHTLKSAAANMGAMMLSQICRAMEKAARDEDAAGYRKLTDPCLAAFEESASALRDVA
jgi:HPt (histidine-containing phosphotransfer) domain-containing protein